MPINPLLLQSVKQALASKKAFVASGPGGAPPADPAAAGGAPPMDPAAMGGMPPPGAGAPPMDPAAMGGMPPMDPAAMGGAPPAPPAPPPPAPPAHDPNMIRQLIQEEIQKSMTGGGAGGEGKPKAKGAGKVDPAQMLEYMERQQKLLVNLYESLGLSLPYDILDKPADPEAEGGQEGQTPAKEQPTSSDISGIPPIQPIKPIGGKQASIGDKAQAMRYMLNAMRRNG